MLSDYHLIVIFINYERYIMENQISINWHVDDVLSVDETLTQSEARQVLYLLKHNHDASIGINWNVIQDVINQLKGASNE